LARVSSSWSGLLGHAGVEELEKFELYTLELAKFHNAFKPSSMLECVVCATCLLKDQAAVCSGGLHALCAKCFQDYAHAEQSQPEQLIQQRGARLLCPCRPPHDAGCTGSFSEQSIASFLPAELHRRHMDHQRIQIHAEEFAKANDMLNTITERLQREMPGISRTLLERQLAAALPGARQCGECGYGPIEHYACDNLQSHHNEARGRNRINNACPQCGWFRENIASWPKWNGRMHPGVAKGPSISMEVRSGLSQSTTSMDDANLRELQRREDAQLAQIHSDHALALRLSRGQHQR